MEPGGSEGALLNAIRTVAETGSTNADLLELARGGAAEGLWLRAERQTAGRGRLGRGWESPAGNLYASTLVRLRANDPAVATLALVAGVAVDEAVATFARVGSGMSRPPRHAGPRSGSDGSAGSPARVQFRTTAQDRGDGEVRLKWPNDLLIDGAKVAGILLERADDAVVIGVGANLAHHPDLPERPTTSLAAHGIEVAPDALLGILTEAFARWLGRWRGEGLAPVRQRWLERAHPLGTALTVRLPDGIALNGLFDGLEADGALMLRLAGGERRIVHAGDVFLL